MDAVALDDERARIGRVLDAAGADSMLGAWVLQDGRAITGLRVSSTVDTEIKLAFARVGGEPLPSPPPIRLRVRPSATYYSVDVGASVSERSLLVVSRTALPRGALRVVVDSEVVSLGGVNPAAELALESAVDAPRERVDVHGPTPGDGDVLCLDEATGKVQWTPLVGAVSADDATTTVAAARERSTRLSTHVTRHEVIGMGIKPSEVARAASLYAALVPGREWTGISYEEHGIVHAEMRSALAPGIVGIAGGGYTVVEPLLVGPRGPIGFAGRVGATGPVGPNGSAVRGERGPTGPAGAKGATGSQGASGAKGPTGTPSQERGETGPVGKDGATGAKGITGPRGPARTEKGPTGPKGEAGPVGKKGPDGEVGATGADGARGPAGATGPTGDVGGTGGKGPSGSVGPAGPTGPNGPRGGTGGVGPKGGAATAAPDAPIEPTFAVPPSPLPSIDCFINAPGSERAAGRYQVVSAIANAHLAFSTGVETSSTSNEITLVMPSVFTLGYIAVSSSVPVVVSGLGADTEWTIVPSNAALAEGTTARQLRFVAAGASRVAFAITARSSQPHSLLRLKTLTGGRATILSSCAATTAGTLTVQPLAGASIVSSGSLGATPRTLVFDGVGISSDAIGTATVSGMVARYPWPGSPMPTQTVVFGPP